MLLLLRLEMLPIIGCDPCSRLLARTARMSVVRIFIRLAILVAGVCLLACSDPRDTTIPPDPARWDTELRSSLDRLSTDERRLVSSYLSRKRGGAARTGQPVAEGVTVRQAIQEERDYQQADAARRSVARGQQDEQERLRKEYEGQVKAVLPVALFSKHVAPADLSTGRGGEYMALVFEFRNLGPRDVAQFRGTLRLADSFRGDPLRSLPVSYGEPIAAGASVLWEAVVPLDPFATSDLRLKNTDAPQIAVTLFPEIVLFADGTRLVMPPGLRAGATS